MFQVAIPHLLSLSGSTAQWHDLGKTIRNDQPLVDGDTPSGAEAYYPNVVPMLGLLFTIAAERTADHLAAPGRRVLDVGAGAVPWSTAIARRDPVCHFTAVDLPALIPVAQEAVAAAGLEARFEYLAGDIFSVDWGRENFDLVIAANICHLFGEPANQRMLVRLYDALRPGGRLAIVDVLSNEGLQVPRLVALYALGLLMRTHSGQVYPFSVYVGWLRKAGFEGIERTDLSDAPPVSLITARRPV